MNLVQKLPLGLGLACLMMMSSCSKEDSQTPEPAESTNASSNLRHGGPVITSVYHFPSTNGPTCVGCAPNTWSLKIPHRDATSSLTAYAGNPAKKWFQPLPAPSTGSGSIITVVNDAMYTGEAKARIENLVKGKKYKITFSVSTTSVNQFNGPSPYASKAVLRVWDEEDITSHLIEFIKDIDFTGKHNQWVTETIEFEAIHNSAYFNFQGYSASGETKLTYTNIHVGSNAVQQIN
jgi:hypothetical protein